MYIRTLLGVPPQVINYNTEFLINKFTFSQNKMVVTKYHTLFEIFNKISNKLHYWSIIQKLL